MKRFLSAIVLFLVVLSVSCALPKWPRKYATTVIHGRVNHLPDSIQYVVGLWGTASNADIKGNMIPYDRVDSAGVFRMKQDMCWPMQIDFDVCGVKLRQLCWPGDTIEIEVDYDKLQRLKNDTERVLAEAVQIRGRSINLSPKYTVFSRKLLWEASAIEMDYLKEHCRNNFVAYREREWEKHLKRLEAADSAALDPKEKELLRLLLEEKYVSRIYSYAFMMEVIGCDSTELAAAKGEFTAVDPHAPSLMFPKTINGVYFFGTDHLDYLQANGLDKLPLGVYLKECKQAKDIVAELNALRDVSVERISALSPEFREALYELRDELADKRVANKDWKPTGEPNTWLQQIVERHRDRVVYIDFWATWCGPCNTGIKEMEKVKAEYEKQGVDFVYITDNSSSTDGFLDLKQEHSGDHFLFTQSDLKAMNIPAYSGAIPHYLIYGRDGKLMKTITGWSGLEAMTQELDKALTK